MDEEELIRDAMRAIGSRRTEKKASSSRANGAKHVMTDETRAKLKAAQQARRDRERQAGMVAPAKNPDAPKRPRGRPRKEQPHPAIVDI